MAFYQVIMIAVSLLALYVFIFHMAGVVRQRRMSSSFYYSMLAFFVLCYLILVEVIGPAAAVSTYAPVYLRSQVIIMALASMSWFLFLYTYLKAGRKWTLWILLISYATIIAAVLLIPGDAIMTGISGFQKNTTGNQPVIIYSGKGFIVWRVLVDLNITFFSLGGLYLVLAGINQLTRSERSMILPLVLIFFFGLNDHLVDYNLISGICLIPFGYVILLAWVHFLLLSSLRQNKNTKSQLLADSSHWWLVFNRLEMIVVGLDRMGNVFYANPYLLRITGYSNEELIGKDWFDIALPPKFTFEVQSAFLEIIERNAHQHYKNPIISKDDEEIDIFWYNVILYDARGRLSGTLSIGVDEKNYSRDDKSLENALTRAQELAESIREEMKKQGRRVL